METQGSATPTLFSSAERARRENVFDVETTLGESLFESVIEQCVKNGSVLLDRVGPGIGTEQSALLFLFRAEPGER